MRVRTALVVLLAVNVLWAAAFLGYVRRSTTPVVKLGADAPAATAKPAVQTTASNAASAVSAATP